MMASSKSIHCSVKRLGGKKKRETKNFPQEEIWYGISMNIYL